MMQGSSQAPEGGLPLHAAVDLIQDEMDTGVLRGKAVSGAFYTAVAQSIKALMSVASQVMLSRLLFPAQFGIVAMVAPVLAIVGLFNDLGLSAAIIQREKINQEDLNSLFWLGLSASSICALLIVAISPLVSLAYHQRAAGPVCAALACQMPLGALAGHSSALMARKMRFKAIALMDVVSQGAMLLVSVVAARLGAGYWALVLGQLAMTLTQAIGDRQFSGWRPSSPKWTSGAVPMLKFGANLTGFNMLSMFSLYADNVLVGILRGPGALGLFDKSFSLVLRPVGSITAPISRIATPLLARIANQPDRYRKTYISMLQGVLILSAPGLIVGSALAPEIVGIFLGKPWSGSAPIMTWICIAAVFTAFSGSSYWLFTSQNRANEQLRCGFVSSGLILVSMLAGLPWGPIGIAKSYALFAPLVHGCFTWKAAQRGPVTRRDVVGGVYPILIALPCAAFVVHSFTGHFGLRPWIDLALSVLLSYLTTISMVLLFPRGRQSAKILLRLRHRSATVALG